MHSQFHLFGTCSRCGTGLVTRSHARSRRLQLAPATRVPSGTSAARPRKRCSADGLQPCKYQLPTSSQLHREATTAFLNAITAGLRNSSVTPNVSAILKTLLSPDETLRARQFVAEHPHVFRPVAEKNGLASLACVVTLTRPPPIGAHRRRCEPRPSEHCDRPVQDGSASRTSVNCARRRRLQQSVGGLLQKVRPMLGLVL